MSRSSALLTILLLVLAGLCAAGDAVDVATFVVALATLGHVCDMRR